MLRTYLNLLLSVAIFVPAKIISYFESVRQSYRTGQRDREPLEPIIPSKLELQETPDGLNDPVSFVVLDDDTSSMPFVINVFTSCFTLSESDATKLMLKVHYQKQATLGYLERHEANKASEYVSAQAAKKEYPLRCEIR